MLVEAASFSYADGGKLLAFPQQAQGGEEDDDGPGAPAADTYQTHSASIVDVKEDFKEKGGEQLAALRKAQLRRAAQVPRGPDLHRCPPRPSPKGPEPPQRGTRRRSEAV